MIPMDAMEESRELSYGIASMDREHSGQLSLLNDLVEHTNLHFLSEQLAMKLQAYEAYESHLLEHERLLVEVRNLSNSLATGTVADRQGLIEALRSWLIVHIQTADKALAEYLSTRTAQQAHVEHKT